MQNFTFRTVTILPNFLRNCLVPILRPTPSMKIPKADFNMLIISKKNRRESPSIFFMKKGLMKRRPLFSSASQPLVWADWYPTPGVSDAAPLDGRAVVFAFEICF